MVFPQPTACSTQVISNPTFSGLNWTELFFLKWWLFFLKLLHPWLETDSRLWWLQLKQFHERLDCFLIHQWLVRQSSGFVGRLLWMMLELLFLLLFLFPLSTQEDFNFDIISDMAFDLAEEDTDTSPHREHIMVFVLSIFRFFKTILSVDFTLH